MPADSEGELLTVLLDVNLFTSRLAAEPGCEATADVLLSQVLTFLRAHLLLNEQNQLNVLAVTPYNSPFLFTSTAATDPEAMSASVAQRLQQLLEQQPDEQQQQQQQQQQQTEQPQAAGTPPEVALSGALSRALCAVRRQLHRYDSARHRGRPRILVLSATPDSPVQYIPVMNAIFAAQAVKVVVDALVLHTGGCSFLQQAAHLTSGLFYQPKPLQANGLLQYLLTLFSADTHTRGALNLPTLSSVDYRASCFCHKEIIDHGYICSVCLSIFCKHNMKLKACLTCGSVFNREGAAAAAAAAAAAGAGSGGGLVTTASQAAPG